MLSPRLLVAVIKYPTYSFVLTGQKFSLTMQQESLKINTVPLVPTPLQKSHITKHLSLFFFFNLYHKGAQECCRSDVKTNVLIKTEAKCIFYNQLHKCNEDFSTQKGFVLLDQEFTNTGLERTSGVSFCS